MSKIQDRIMEKASYARIPIMCSFELLPVCNLQCKMCYVRKSMDHVRRNGGLKDADWWLALAKAGAEQGLLYPLLTGGEPFLHPEFDRILSGMLDMGLQVSINTNGTLIDRTWAAFLRDHRPTRINLTLYGASRETYRRLCGHADAYDRVVEAVELLKEFGIPLKFNASITPDNVDDLPGMIAFAQKHDCPIQVATYMFPPLRRDSRLVGQNARMTPEEAANARAQADLLQNDPVWFVTQAARFRSFIPLEREPWLMQEPQGSGMRCRAGLCSLWVDWQGNFSNCGMYPSVSAPGSPERFRDDWERVVRETAQVQFTAPCNSCPNRPICHPCIAMIYNECGSVTGRPVYLCRMNEALARAYDRLAREHYPDVAPAFVFPQDPQDTCEI